jgi:transcriptional regulator with GAF, ATPase, and Fis domain
MPPRLIALTGPLKGAVINLTDEEVSIGREGANNVRLDTDLSVSRRHCLIKSAESAFVTVDLGSFNGTYVNGLPIHEKTLSHGDRIVVGDSTFIFLTEEGDPPAPRLAVELDDLHNLSETVRLRQEDVLYLQPEKIAALPPTARMARDLNALLKISTTINSTQGVESIQRQLLDLIFDVVPAERGAILLTGPTRRNSEEFSSVFGWRRGESGDAPVRCSRTIAQKVLKEGVAMLSNNVLEGDGSSVESLASEETRSLLAVPLVAYDRKLGVIYLSTSDPISWFDEDHLQLVTAIAGIAAVAIKNAQERELLESENQRLNAEINIEHDMVGEGARMRDVLQFIARVAPMDTTALIRGESGTGKELAARALHNNSERSSKPFVAINCAAIAEGLLESELFGHERGAFTGAIAMKKGKLELADGGTLFLDEIGEMSPFLQAKLLRVLQDHEFERVGGTRAMKSDIRLIAATNRDLEDAIRQGAFRVDLYYRLNVVSLIMPPLRERKEDIPLLANYFATKYAAKCKRQVRGISQEAHACLTDYDWPGNVRELENAIERAVVLGTEEFILPEDLPEALLEKGSPPGGPATRYHDAVGAAKKQVILKALEQANGSVTDAARLLDVHPNYLHRLLRNLNLRPELKK